MTTINGKERAYVVFQGGGALGIAHFGAWEAIANKFDIVGVAGTSSGSIVAALCAAGVSPDDPDDTTFKSFKESLPGFFGHKSFPCLMVEIGCRALFGQDASNDGGCFQNWLEEQLKQCLLKKSNITSDLNKGYITFEELYDHSKIYLEVVACDLKDEKQNPIVFSHMERKTTSISKAVCASISLPGLFKPVSIGNQDFIDGGILLNFPIQKLYERAEKQDYFLIGVCFKKKQRSFNPFNIKQVFLRVYEILISKSSPGSDELQKYSKYSKCIITEIDDEGRNPLNFDLSDEELNKLRKTGKDAVREQLALRLNEIKSRLIENLPSGTRKSVDQAQLWFISEARPKLKEYCQVILTQEKFRNLAKNEDEVEKLYREIDKYLERISESFLNPDLKLLTNNLSLSDLSEFGIPPKNINLISPALDNFDIYSEILTHITSHIPDYLSAKNEIIKRINFLKATIKQHFSASSQK